MAESGDQHIVIKNGSGKHPDLHVHAKLNGTLLDLKKILQEQYSGSPVPSRQTLIHAGKVLKDEQAPLHTLLRTDLEPTSGPISLHLVVKAEVAQPHSAVEATAAGQPSATPGQASATPGQTSAGRDLQGRGQSVAGAPTQACDSGSSSGDESNSSGGSSEQESERNRWYGQQHTQFWEQQAAAPALHPAASTQHPAASAQPPHSVGGAPPASASFGSNSYPQPYSINYGPQFGQQYGQQYTIPYSLPPMQPLHPYAYMPQLPPPASLSSSQPPPWQPYTPALSAAYSAAMASLTEPLAAPSSSSGGHVSLPQPPPGLTPTAAAAGGEAAAASAPASNSSGSNSHSVPSSAGHNSRDSDASSGHAAATAAIAATQLPSGGLAAAVAAGGFPIVALVPVGMLNSLGLHQQQQQQEGSHASAGAGVNDGRQSEAASQPSDPPPAYPSMFLPCPVAPPTTGFTFGHPGAAGPPWSVAPPPLQHGPWGSTAVPPLPTPPPFPPPPGYYFEGTQFRGMPRLQPHQQTGPGGASMQQDQHEGGQRFPPGGGLLPDGRPLAPFPPDAAGAGAAGWPPPPQGGARRRRQQRQEGGGGGGNGGQPMQLPQGLNVAGELRRAVEGEGGVQPQVRGFAVQFNINMRAMIQVAVILVLLYQHCPPGRFFALVVGGGVLWFSAFSPLRRWMQRFVGDFHRGGAPAIPPDGAPAGGAPGGGDDGDRQRGIQGAEVAPRRGNILREVFALLIGFFTSLLPGWNLNPEDAAAFAVAQQAAAAQVAREARDGEAAAAAAGPQ